jgi:hypothetical protein
MAPVYPQLVPLRRSRRTCDHCVIQQQEASRAGRPAPQRRMATTRIKHPSGSEQPDAYLCGGHLEDWKTARASARLRRAYPRGGVW